MILEYFDTSIWDGFVILVPAILFAIIGAIATYHSNTWAQKALSIVIFILGIVGLEECIYSGYVRPVEPPIVYVTKHPVELRQENNTLYVFYQGSLNKVSGYTSEYVTDKDTMYVYTTETIGGRLSWGENTETTFKPKTNIVWRDSVDITVETGKTTLTPEDFHPESPTLEILTNDSLAH